MTILVFGVWFVVCSIVGVRSARDISRQNIDHETAALLATQTVGDK